MGEESTTDTSEEKKVIEKVTDKPKDKDNSVINEDTYKASQLSFKNEFQNISYFCCLIFLEK